MGIVGTGYAAQRRAEVLLADPRAQLVSVAGHSAEKTAAFCQQFGIKAADSWQNLVTNPDLDLVIVATINQLHGAIAEVGLKAGKHLVLEYPLALDYETGISIAVSYWFIKDIDYIEHKATNEQK